MYTIWVDLDMHVVQRTTICSTELRREYSDLPKEMVDAKLLQCVPLKYTIYLLVSLQRPMHRCVYAYLLVMAPFLPSCEAEAPVAAFHYLMPAFQSKSHLYQLRHAISRLDKYFMHCNLHCHDILTNKRPATVHFLVLPPCDFSADIFSIPLSLRSFIHLFTFFFVLRQTRQALDSRYSFRVSSERCAHPERSGISPSTGQIISRSYLWLKFIFPFFFLFRLFSQKLL